MSETSRPADRLLLSEAMRAARYYDGREQAFDRLISSVGSFERYAQRANAAASRDEAEAQASRELRRTGRPLTVDGLLDVAIKTFQRSMASGTAKLPVQESELCFLPTQGRVSLPRGHGGSFEGPRLDARAARLVQDLNRSGVFTDDLIIHKGRTQPGAMRQEAYTLIQMPRHDREVLVCDQVGNATFIGKGLRGPIFWSTYGKQHLSQFPDIARVVNREQDNAEVIDLVLRDNPLRQKAAVSRVIAQPLTENLILTHALRHAEANAGKLPTVDSKDIDGLSGQTWVAWQIALRTRSRGLTREGVKGLSDLFNLYNLKNGNSENPEVVSQAMRNLHETGTHGLTADESGNRGKLTEDLILTHALRHAEVNAGKLPTQNSKDIEGLPGQNWIAWDYALRHQARGLTRKGVKGLNNFFNLYNLKNGNLENPEVVSRAIRSLHETGIHGLTADESGNRGKLTEDLILTHALRHAEANAGRLPTQNSKDIEGLPGQSWRAWEAALRNRSRGLTREGVKGVSHLFDLYGLKKWTNGKPASHRNRPSKAEPYRPSWIDALAASRCTGAAGTADSARANGPYRYPSTGCYTPHGDVTAF